MSRDPAPDFGRRYPWGGRSLRRRSVRPQARRHRSGGVFDDIRSRRSADSTMRNARLSRRRPEILRPGAGGAGIGPAIGDEAAAATCSAGMSVAVEGTNGSPPAAARSRVVLGDPRSMTPGGSRSGWSTKCARAALRNSTFRKRSSQFRRHGSLPVGAASCGECRQATVFARVFRSSPRCDGVSPANPCDGMPN